MPRSIALETSGRVGSVAVVDDDKIVAEQTFPHGLKNAAGIIPIIDSLIQTRGWKPADLQQVFLSIGPGSFTGLRIAVTLAKTLALATGVKLVAVPTVNVLAANAPADAENLIIVLDAKRDQIFTASFTRQNDKWIEQEPTHLDSLTSMLAKTPRSVHLLGEGIPYHEKFIPKEDGIIITPPESWIARASVVAELGMKLAKENHFADPFTLTPMYVRKPEALEKWEAANAEITARDRK